MIKELSGFPLGFVSDRDVSKDKSPEGSLSDCLNMEINTPLLMLTKAYGHNTYKELPQYSGSRNVAFYRWGVDTPSERELFTLIRASENMLKYSEDFEISAATSSWVFTSGGGGTLTPNYSAGPVRRADFVDNVTLLTKIEQSWNGVVGIGYTFSLYIKNNTTGVRISIEDAAGSDQYEHTTQETEWTRISVSRTLLSATGTKVVIDFPSGAGTEETEIWGAQLELGASMTGYGPTYEQSKPYYIFLRPYWDGTQWIDDWENLTEQRAGKVTAEVDNQYFEIANFDGSDTYYKNWRVYVVGFWSKHPLYVHTYTHAFRRFTTWRTSQINGSSNLNTNDQVVIFKYISQFESPNLIDGTSIDESKITFEEVSGTLHISFGNTHKPLKIKYIKTTNALHTSSFDIAYDKLILSNNTFAPENISALIAGSAVSTFGEYLGFKIGDLTPGGSGSLEAGTYWLGVVGVLDSSQRVLLWSRETGFAVSANGHILLFYSIQESYFNPRLTKLEFYLGTSNSDWEKVFVTHQMIDNATTSWARNSTFNERLERSVTISSIDYTQPTLLQALGRASIIETRNQYNIQHYLRGRKFTAKYLQPTVASGNSDKVRFSHIRAGVEELDIFPLSDSEGYGFIVASGGDTEGIVGFGSTRDNDLLVFKNKSIHLYEVQSGAVTKRLIRVVDGIGAANDKVIVESDYGVFWIDRGGAYQYTGGITVPRKISDGRVTNYIKEEFGDDEIADAFAIFYRKYEEYWVFIANKVLRYSPKFNNWNILQFPVTVLGVSQLLNGQLLFITSSSGILIHGYDAVGLGNYYAQTQYLTFDDISGQKEIVDINAEYEATPNFKIGLKINSESSYRPGNDMVFLNTRKRMSKQPRVGSQFAKCRLNIHLTELGLFNLTTITLDVQGMRRRYGRR